MLIGIIGWVVLGLVVGFAASKVVNLHGDDPRLGIAMGAAGGLIGGWLYVAISGSSVAKFDAMSLLCAAIGGALAAGIWYVVRSRSAPVEYQNRRYR
jgi:uncharacterized membrane protein YeaQ/YmgE (transglycosylase-associated protein family)